MSKLVEETRLAINKQLEIEVYTVYKEEEDLIEDIKYNTNHASETDKNIDPNEPNQILPYLYLGSKISASNLELLQEVGITHIINCAKEIPNYFEDYDMDIPSPNEEEALNYKSKLYKRFIKYLSLKQDDRMDQLMHKQFPIVIDFIDNAREENVNNKIFVHCQAGISRSATNVIAYLMAREDMSLKEAFLHTKACRHQIGPNLGFMEQLMKYEKQIFSISKTTFSMKEYYVASLVQMGIKEEIAVKAIELSDGRFSLALNYALSGQLS
eukprot:g7998.t1